MWKARQSPECKGLQVEFSTSRERLQEMRERAGRKYVDRSGVVFSVIECIEMMF